MNITYAIKQFTAISLGLGIILSANAGQYAAVDKNGCKRLENTSSPFILILRNGDKLHESITQCANDAKLQAASISGLGQVQNPTLAAFSSNPNEKPILTSFKGFFELVSLNGNITNNNGKRYTHLHGTFALAKQQFQAVAGHFDSAMAGMTVEVTIVPFSGPIERVVDEHTGFGPISTR